MEKEEKVRKDKLEIKRNKFVSLAFIGGIFAILVTLLQVDKKDILQSFSLKWGITILCIILPILILDAFSTHMEEIRGEIKGFDGKTESKFRRGMRFIIWGICGIGFVSTFNYLPNVFSSLNNRYLSAIGTYMVIGFFLFTMINVYPHAKRRLKKAILISKKEEKEEKMKEIYEDFKKTKKEE